MNQTPTIEFILPKWVIFATGEIKIRIAAIFPFPIDLTANLDYNLKLIIRKGK
jgi:hypothetical protein